MIREGRINEGFLPFQRFHSAAARLFVVIEGRISELWKYLGDGSKTRSRSSIHPIPRLPEHELPARRMIPQVKPVKHGASLSRHFASNRLPRSTVVHAPDDDVHTIQTRLRAKMVRHCMPIQIPEQIETRNKDYRLRMPDLGLAEGLPNAVCRRYCVSVHQCHLQSARVTMD